MSSRYQNLPIEQVRANLKNTRTHSKKQIRQIATSIRELGFTSQIGHSDTRFHARNSPSRGLFGDFRRST